MEEQTMPVSTPQEEPKEVPSSATIAKAPEEKPKQEGHTISMTEAKDFIDSLSVVSELVNEVVVKFKPEGVSILAMDAANVAMVIFRYKSDGFIDYKCETEAEYGVNLPELNKALKRVNAKDILTLHFDNRLTVKAKGSREKVFTVGLLADVEQKKDEPNLNCAVSVKTDSKEFSEAILDAEIIGKDGSVSMVGEGESFGVYAEQDVKSANIGLATTQIAVQKDAGKVVGRYSIEYMKKLCKGSKLSKEVTVRFGNDYPIVVKYKGDKTEVKFILAPRVDNN
jgi:proliferating cell nuclear antigen